MDFWSKKVANGNNNFGGIDMDKILIDYITEEFKKESKNDLKNDYMAI